MIFVYNGGNKGVIGGFALSAYMSPTSLTEHFLH